MSRGRTIATNSAALLLSNVGNKITGFLIMLTVAKLLGVDRFGLYTTVFAYVSVFGLFSDLGLTTVVVRKLSQEREAGRRWLGNALLVRWPLAVGSYVFCVGSAAIFYGNDERTWLIALSALSYVAVPLGTHTAIFHALLRPHGPALISVGSRLILLAVVQWLARTEGTLAMLIGAEVIVGTANNVIVWLWSRRLLRPSLQWDRQNVGSMLSEGIPLFLTAAFVMLYFRIDVFFLEYYWDNDQIGIYAAAYRLTEALPLIAGALANAIFPVLCQQVHESQEDSLNKLIRISLKILLGVVVPVAIVLSYYSDSIIDLLYGPGFSGSAPLLAVLSFSQILVYTNILLSVLLVARGKGHVLMYLTLGMLTFNIAINFIVIPRYGALGATWTTMATEFTGTIGCVILTATTGIFVSTLGRLAIPAAVSLATLALLDPGPVSDTVTSFWPAVAVLVIYTLTAVVLRVFDREEWDRLRKLAWQ